MSDPLDLTYPAVLDYLQPYLAGSRTESEAFLMWFLEHIYRLEETEASDSVCDGPDDKGVDGLYIDENLERVDIFQSKLVKTAKDKTLGDTQLKEFLGTLAQFRDPAEVVQIAKTTGNMELRNLLEANDVAAKVGSGYLVRGVFVTNVPRDAAASEYLALQPNLTLYDRVQIMASYIPPGPTIPMARPVVFDIYGYDYAEYNVSGIRTIVAPLSATQLVQLDGLASGALFAWNVRQSLGKTKVNKEISLSIQNRSEHTCFLLYHNGLTILCSSIQKDGDKITISGYSVVNGCQSLTSLYDNRSHVTDDLRVLSRLIELSPNSELAAKITHHSNNQNSISARDLQSNSALQRRLQNEFNKAFKGKVFYQIKRGEVSVSPETIDNEEAARVVLAFDLRQPWTCHQTYKLFDELHAEIFAKPEITAQRIYVLTQLYNVVWETLPKLENQLMARYRLTRYFLLFLLRAVLEQDDVGKEFCRQPEVFLCAENGLSRIRTCAARVLEDIIIDLNAELRERDEQGNHFDYKRGLKSPNMVRGLERAITPQYQKAVSRGRATSFGQEWALSG